MTKKYIFQMITEVHQEITVDAENYKEAEQKLEDGKYGIKGFQGYIIQGFHLNRYSEVSYILYENNGNKGILPIKPNRITEVYKGIPKYYDLKNEYINI